MIFVAIGTTYFNELVRAIDELAPTLSEKVVAQIGWSTYVPVHCESFRFAPSLEHYYEQASCVVSHGGFGITTEVMKRGIPLVCVEDPRQPGRHQQQILGEWEQEGHLIWCKRLEDLPAALRCIRRDFKPYTPPMCQIPVIIRKYLDTLEPISQAEARQHGNKAWVKLLRKF